ncbi:MAG: Serine/Threonine/Tyrosine Kinase found in polyvalent protein [Verrucomicrobiota bacterium]|jgi:hypothetical protein
MLPSDVTQHLLQAGSAGALADAAAYLRRRLRPDGALNGHDDDGDLAEHQWALLLEWAGASGQILPLEFPAPDREGGREHDVSLHEPSGRWIKYTKPSACGFTVSWSESGQPYLHNASPLDYLQRLLWQNDALGDDIHLVGLWQAQPHRWRIVTTQPGLQGSRVTLEELSAAFIAAGFTVLPWRGLGYEHSLSLRFGGYDLWDVHPANVLLSPEGLPLPLDVILTRSP